MPPKRKVPARRVTKGRPMRSVAVNIDYKLTSTCASPKHPKKQTKNVKDEPTDLPLAASPKKRGKPPKANEAPPSTTAEEIETVVAAAPAKAGRGRPKTSISTSNATLTNPAKRKRDDEEPVTAPPKKRGRPPKNETAATKARKELPVKVEKTAKTSKKVKSSPARGSTTTVKTTTKRGRPPGSTNKPKAAAAVKTAKTKASKKTTSADAAELGEGLTQEDGQDAGDFQYWLMKAEPDTRVVKGVDVAFPIDKLAQATEPEPWDGVRNPVARNNMRAMRKGDLAFFYHSNCLVPGIVGVMRVAEEHSIDESAFDPEHPYYDEKSVREKPKWDCVKVEFVKKFAEPITLKQVKNTSDLSTMQLAQKAFGRLSVQRVTPSEWQTVLKMANEPEDLGVVAVVSGYEADTNGETDKEAADESVGIDDVDAAYLTANGSADDLLNDDATNTKKSNLKTPNAKSRSSFVNGLTKPTDHGEDEAEEDEILASGEDN